MHLFASIRICSHLFAYSIYPRVTAAILGSPVAASFSVIFARSAATIHLGANFHSISSPSFPISSYFFPIGSLYSLVTMPQVNDGTKVSTVISFLLSIYVNIRYFVGRSPYDKHSSFNVSNTPFSANILVTLTFWALLYLLQLLFISQIFLPSVESDSSRAKYTKKVAWHFTVFNLLTFFWTILFTKKHFFLSEILLVINLANIITLYFNHKTYAIRPLGDWVLIHLSTCSFPLSWLFYSVFWNGAVLFNVHKLFGRIIANVLIWDFLLVPLVFIILFNDWGVGLSSTLLMFGLGLGQLLVKVFALQWIFAFVISGILFLFSVIAMATTSFVIVEIETEQAPLIEPA